MSADQDKTDDVPPGAEATSEPAAEPGSAAEDDGAVLTALDTQPAVPQARSAESDAPPGDIVTLPNRDTGSGGDDPHTREHPRDRRGQRLGCRRPKVRAELASEWPRRHVPGRAQGTSTPDVKLSRSDLASSSASGQSGPSSSCSPAVSGVPG